MLSSQLTLETGLSVTPYTLPLSAPVTNSPGLASTAASQPVAMGLRRKWEGPGNLGRRESRGENCPPCDHRCSRGDHGHCEGYVL